MFWDLVKKAESERLGSAFAVLLAIFFGIGAMAVTGERHSAEPALVSSSVEFDGPVSADGAGLMLAGRDPVAYFLEERAVLGAKAWTARWGAAEFRFASRENRDIFLSDPTRFLPQFGGHDAEGVRLGELRKADPNAFVIVEDRLYLLANARVKAAWRADGLRNAAVADSIWPRLLHLLGA